MGDNGESIWINQTLFYYQDPSTSARLTATLDSGVSIDDGFKPKYHSLRITLCISDSREVPNGRVRFEMDYTNIDTFLNTARYLVGNQMGVAKAISSGYQFTLHRFLSKSQKDLVVCARDIGGPKIVIKILDPISNLRKGVLSIGETSFMNLCKLIRHVYDQYVPVSVNSIVALNQERLMSKMDTLIKKIDNLSQVQSRPPVIVEVPKSTVEEIPPDVLIGEEDPSDVQSRVLDALSDPSVDNIALEEVAEKKPKTDVIPTTFIGDFLHCDIKSIIQWTVAYMNRPDGASLETFILNSGVPGSESSQIIDDENFQKNQYLIKEFLVREIRNYVDGKIDDFPREYPIVKLPVTISKSTTPKLYKLVQEALTVLVVFNLVYQTALKHLKAAGESQIKIEEYRRTYFIYKVITTPLYTSLRIDDIDEFMQGVGRCFSSYKTKGAIENLEEDYAHLATGGQWAVTQELFSNSLTTFLKLLKNVSAADSEDVDIVLEKYGVVEAAEEETPHVDSPEGILEADENIDDPRLKTYVSLLKKLGDYQFSTIPKSFDEVPSQLESENPPDVAFTIKRVMDSYTSEENIIRLEKRIKEFSEDINVTRARVLQGEMSIDANGADFTQEVF